MPAERPSFSRYGLSQWGSLLWAYTPENIGSTLTGQGVLTGTGSLVGLIAGAVSFLGQGVLFYPIFCNRDMILLSIQMPRSIVAVMMPVAYITQINMPTEVPGCGPSSNTTPATGSFNTLVAISDDPEDN